jgi:class 3 adenylate cyclase
VPPETRTGPPRTYTLAHLAARILTSQQRLTGERKLVTLLVVSVEGLWALRQAVDPAALDAVLNQGFAQFVAEVHRVEGFVLQVAGHGITVLFGAPLACEDHVLRALHAALRIQRAFTVWAAELRQTYKEIDTCSPSR